MQTLGHRRKVSTPTHCDRYRGQPEVGSPDRQASNTALIAGRFLVFTASGVAVVAGFFLDICSGFFVVVSAGVQKPQVFEQLRFIHTLCFSHHFCFIKRWQMLKPFLSTHSSVLVDGFPVFVLDAASGLLVVGVVIVVVARRVDFTPTCMVGVVVNAVLVFVEFENEVCLTP